MKEYPFTVREIKEAEYVYIPFFWTRYHLRNNYGLTGLEELQAAVDRIEELGLPTFTVCQYDDGPLVRLENCKIFLGSRKTQEDLDAPLLATRLPGRVVVNDSKYSFNFIGRQDTHRIRGELIAALNERGNSFVQVERISARRYAKVLHQSEITLAPRGYGGSSFRFYEAIQAGSIPWLIGDIDTRPFKSQIQWDEYSIYSRTVPEFIQQFEELTQERVRLMRHKVRTTLKPVLRLGHWNQLLIRELCD